MPTVSAEPVPVLEFRAALPGFPAHRRFTLVRLDEVGLLYALRSLDDPELRFLVMPPAACFPAYAPEIDDASAALLELDRPEDALVLCVVTPGDRVEDATANLLAPIVVNQRNQAAAQVVLGGSEHAIRTPLRPS